MKLRVLTRMYKNCHRAAPQDTSYKLHFLKSKWIHFFLFFDTKAHKEVDGFVHLWNLEFVDVLLLVAV